MIVTAVSRMIAKSGDALLQTEAQDALTKRLLPKAYLLTPNVPEAEILTGRTITDASSMKKAACVLFDMGAKNVLMKGH